MSKFKIPVMWAMAGEVEVEADTLEAAAELAQQNDQLPADGEYIDGSFLVNQGLIQDMQDEERESHYCKEVTV